jgi:branched-chain amino acid transport system ATP-binding protein
MISLRLDSVHVSYGAVRALSQVSMDVSAGEIVALIGANGAGKSTLLMAVSGMLRPSQGSIWFEDTRIDGLPSHRIVAMGICQVPEGRRIFSGLTVYENLRMGAYIAKDHRQLEEGIKRVLAIFPVLKERITQKGGTLSGGEQQMLAIGRAMVLTPQLLLLDEPSLGLAPKLVDSVFDKIVEINRSGTTVLLVEQNARMALEIADRGYVIRTGEIVLSGSGKKLLTDPLVQELYLGG